MIIEVRSKGKLPILMDGRFSEKGAIQFCSALLGSIGARVVQATDTKEGLEVRSPGLDVYLFCVGLRMQSPITDYIEIEV